MQKEMPMTMRIERYKERYWALYVDEELLVVSVYKKGAERIKKLIEMILKIDN